MAMFFQHFQEHTKKTAIYPDACKGTVPAISYCALGLAGEAGEIANKVKKLIRDGDTAELRDKIRAEVGDALWYLARLADELGVQLGDLAYQNVIKLQDRKERGVLNGSGDNR
jgi:NTP pyrophosphatase (non-canonical NTP hydrolase)